MAKQVFCRAVLLISILTFTATAHALEVVNKRSTDITVFAPPQCQPCTCPMIYCIRAPCEQLCPCPQQTCPDGEKCNPPCVCPRVCKLLPGGVVAPGSSGIFAPDEAYPLAYLTVEVWGQVYIVIAADLKLITSISTLVITNKACAGRGVAAELYLNSKFAEFKTICLVQGERYGS